MPRLNRTGQIAQGLGLCWLDDTRRIQQLNINGVWRVCVDGVPVSDRGCNFLAAGGGFWLAYIPGYGVFGSDGLYLEGAALPAGLDGRGAASFDGAVAIADNTQNIGLTLLTANGVTAQVPNARLTDKLCVVSRTQALWIDQDNEPQTIGLPVPQMLPGQRLWPRVLRLVDEWWICYHADDAIGVVLHPFDSFDGYALTLPPAFYLDAVSLSSTVARVVWARDSAEARIDSRDVDVTQPRVHLGVSSPTPVPPPEPIPEPNPMTNSEANPRITSPLDDAYLDAAIRASWRGTRGGDIPPDDLAYWIAKAQSSEQYSDGLWRKGWNAYWEARMRPGNEAAADPGLADQPAKFQPSSTEPPSDPKPVPAPGPDLLAAIVELRWRVVELEQRLADTEARLLSRIDVLERRPLDLVAIQSAIDGVLVNYEVTGKTEKDKLGLQHLIKLGISRRK